MLVEGLQVCGLGGGGFEDVCTHSYLSEATQTAVLAQS